MMHHKHYQFDSLTLNCCPLVFIYLTYSMMYKKTISSLKIIKSLNSISIGWGYIIFETMADQLNEEQIA